MKETFKTGNFNEWEAVITKHLPKIIKEIREDVVTSVDDIIKEMLGNTENVEKESINIIPIFNFNNIPRIQNNTSNNTSYNKNLTLKEVITKIQCNVEYVVQDFKAENIPEDIIHKDEETIKNSFTYNIPVEVKINTKTGNLSLKFEFYLGE